LFIFLIPGVENTGHLWAYIFPLVAAFLLGARKGAFAISTVVAAILALWMYDLSQGKAVYSIALVVRFIVSFFIISFAACYYEHFRQETLHQLAESNLQLDTQIAN